MHIKKIGSYEAKTHLSSLLDSVAKGEKIIITRKGTPIAILAPYQEENLSIENGIQALLNFKKKNKLKLSNALIAKMREEGRRF